MDWKGDMDEHSQWADVMDRGRMVWELLVRPSRSMQQKCGGQEDMCMLEVGVGKMKLGRRLLGANNTVAGMAVQGNL